MAQDTPKRTQTSTMQFDPLGSFLAALRVAVQDTLFTVRVENFSNRDGCFVFVERPDHLAGGHVCVHRDGTDYRFVQYGMYVEESERNKGLGTLIADILVKGYRAIGLRNVPVHMVINERWFKKVCERHPGTFRDMRIPYKGDTHA